MARAIAELIVAGALADGDQLFDDAEPAPEGDDLHARISRAQYERRDLAHQAEWDAALAYDADADAATKAFFAAARKHAEGASG